MILVKNYYWAPNGNNDKDANLKHCFPKGIPIIVMCKIIPTIKYPTAISQPNKISHKTLAIGCESKLVWIVFPKGKSEKDAILKHWTPNGIPIMVIHHNKPNIIHNTNDNSPTMTNQRTFPNNFIYFSPL